jgi:hypothetical protein
MNPKSASPKKTDIASEKTMTTMTSFIVSFLLGQVICLNSETAPEIKEFKDFIYAKTL